MSDSGNGLSAHLSSPLIFSYIRTYVLSFSYTILGFLHLIVKWYHSHNLFSPSPPSDATVVIPGEPPLPTPTQYPLLPRLPSSPLSSLLVVALLRTAHLVTPTSSIPSYYKVCINNLWLLHTLRFRVSILRYHTSRHLRLILR